MSKPAGRLLIRADAGPTIGSGHLMRCLALGQRWKELGGDVELLTHELPRRLAERVQREGIRFQTTAKRPGSGADAQQTAQVARDADWVVVDGYHFGDAFRARLKEAGPRVLAIDDVGDVAVADIVVNQNLHAEISRYGHRGTHALSLLGGRYALLRSEFARRRCFQRVTRPRVQRVLVTCGGSDPSNLTAKVLHGLSRAGLEGLQVTGIVGGGNPRLSPLRKLADQAPVPIRLEHDSRNMADWMAWADLAITAAGSTCWEMACTGLPALVVITADNQVPVAESMESHGLGRSLGWGHELRGESIVESLRDLSRDADERESMSCRGRRLIDGLGCERVARLLMEPELRLRPAGWDDCRRLWQWRNDPSVRSASFSTGEIPFESHSQWFAERLRADNCEILIAENAAGCPVGQVRFDIDGERAEISVAVGPQYRGSGLGTALIRVATEAMLGGRRAVRIDAFIKRDNLPSRRAFEKAGYRQSDCDPPSQRGLHYVASTGISELAHLYKRSA